MAKYPRLFGNDTEEYNIHGSNGLPLATEDAVFDVYVYTNAGLEDNTQRASAVVVIKNEQIAGTVTSLTVNTIALHTTSSGSVSYTGSNVSLNPMISGVPFIGSEESYEGATGNKIIAKDANNKPGVSADTDNGLEVGQIKIASTFTSGVPDPGSEISSTDIDPDLAAGTYRSILVHNPEDLTINQGLDNPIPSDSYASFVVGFHPTEDIPNNTTECYLKIQTNVGNISYPLVVNSFNEIIMVAKKGSSSYGGTQDLDLTIGSSITYDDGTVHLGYHPRTNNTTKLQDDLLADGIKIVDISPNATDASYKWINSASNATSITGDGTTLSLPTNHTSGSFDHFYNDAFASINNYYTDETYFDTLALSGTTSVADGATLYNVAGNAPLFQFFDTVHADTSIIDGTHGGGYTTNYTLGDFAKALTFRVNYHSVQYNNTSSASAAFPDDGDGFNSQFFKYAVTYGVYQKVTIPSGQASGQQNEIDASTEAVSPFNKKYDVTSAASGPNGNIAQTGSRYDMSHDVRWNNFAGLDVNGKYSLADFTFSTNTNNFKYLGTNTNNCVPTSFTIGVTTSTTGTFNHFGWNDPSVEYRDVTILSPFLFTLTPSVYFGSSFVLEFESEVGTSYLMNPITKSGGTVEASLVPNPTDAVWNFADGAEYPGLHGDNNISYKTRFYPRSPYLKIGMLTETSRFDHDSASPGYPSGTGLLSNSVSTTNVIDVTTWYNDSSQVINNTTAAFGTNQPSNKMYSGFGGVVFDNNTFATNLQCLIADASYNQNKVGIKDKTGSSIKEFFPFNKTLNCPIPIKHPSTDKYTSFQSFLPFNEGDSNIYLHSIDVLTGADGVGTDQLLDFDVSAAAVNLAGTATYGYKPGFNTNNANAGSSNDPVLSFLVEGMDTTFQSSERKYHNTSGSFTNGNPAKFYRDNAAGSAYYPPKFMQGYDNIDSDINDYLYSVNETGIEDEMDCNKIAKWIPASGISWPEASSSAAGAAAPKGNLPIHLRMEVDAKGTTIDFGEYYTTLKIRYFKHDYFSMKKASAVTSANTTATDFRIHEMRVVVKMNLQPTPLLVVADAEGQEFTSAAEINLGNVNIG